MTSTPSITDALKRNRRAFDRAPKVSRQHTSTRASSRNGFTTTCTEGPYSFTCDMPAIFGGTGQAPTPGTLGRACLASCVVMGVRIAAELHGVTVDEITVELSMDWDNRGIFGMNNVSPGPENVCLKISLCSPAPEDMLRDVVEDGLKNDPWLVALQEPNTVKTELSVTKGA